MKKNNNNAGPWRKDWPNARYRSPRQKIDAPTRTVIPQCPDTRPAAKFRIKKWQRKARAMAFRKQGRRNGRARVGAPSSARGKKLKGKSGKGNVIFKRSLTGLPSMRIRSGPREADANPGPDAHEMSQCPAVKLQTQKS